MAVNGYQKMSFMMFRRCNKLCHSSRVKLPVVKMSATLVFGFDILDLDFGVQVDSVK